MYWKGDHCFRRVSERAIRIEIASYYAIDSFIETYVLDNPFTADHSAHKRNCMATAFENPGSDSKTLILPDLELNQNRLQVSEFGIKLQVCVVHN